MGFRHRVKTSPFARDTGHLAVGQSLRLIIQAAYFVLIARILGPGEIWSLRRHVALVGILTPFSGLGTNNLFVKNVRTGKRTAGLCWGNGLIATMASGTAFSGCSFRDQLSVSLADAVLLWWQRCVSPTCFS